VTADGLLASIPLGPPVEAIEAGIVTELSVGLLLCGLFAILTFVLRTFRGR
jgi:hypothetical protein